MKDLGQRAPAVAGPGSWSRRGFLGSTAAVALAGLGARPARAAGATLDDLPSRAAVVARFGSREPEHFGMFLSHMLTHVDRRTALTFDACGGPRGSHYDGALVETLRKHKVPATLFLNARWIATFPTVAAELAADPLFELGNHGSQHRPLTVRGQAAYGIAGTRSVGEAYDEIVRGMDAVAGLTGGRPVWFRPGTAWADDVGVGVAGALGVRVTSFSVNADAGATASRKDVTANLSGAPSRAITLGHFNHPEGQTAEGLARALPVLLDRGRRFMTLSAACA